MGACRALRTGAARLARVEWLFTAAIVAASGLTTWFAGYLGYRLLVDPA